MDLLRLVTAGGLCNVFKSYVLRCRLSMEAKCGVSYADFNSWNGLWSNYHWTHTILTSTGKGHWPWEVRGHGQPHGRHPGSRLEQGEGEMNRLGHLNEKWNESRQHHGCAPLAINKMTSSPCSWDDFHHDDSSNKLLVKIILHTFIMFLTARLDNKLNLSMSMTPLNYF